MKAYKLKFQSSCHIDAGTSVDGPSETFIHSDTLFSAVVSAASKFYGKEVVEKFLMPDAVVLSSAFPFYKDELFLPKPLHFFPANLKEYEMVKVFKKARFVSTELLFKIISGVEVDEEYFTKDFILNGCWRVNRNIKDNNSEERIFEVQEVPHVIMDRITNQTQIFYKSEVYFHKEAGLFFLAQIDENLVNEFETVLRFLGDEGIGADRTIGKGLFEVEKVEDFSVPPLNHTGYYYLLSLYSPTKDEFQNISPEKSFYDLIIRGGYVLNNTLNRKNLRMFTEGSVLFFNNDIKPKGCLKKVLDFNQYKNDLKSDIYRNGQALFLPVMGGLNEY
jgi:CRISPR-associated protein Csm4